MHTKDGMIGRLREYINQSIRRDKSIVILYLNEVEDIITLLSEENSNVKFLLDADQKTKNIKPGNY